MKCYSHAHVCVSHRNSSNFTISSWSFLQVKVWTLMHDHVTIDALHTHIYVLIMNVLVSCRHDGVIIMVLLIWMNPCIVVSPYHSSSVSSVVLRYSTFWVSRYTISKFFDTILYHDTIMKWPWLILTSIIATALTEKEISWAIKTTYRWYIRN